MNAALMLLERLNAAFMSYEGVGLARRTGRPSTRRCPPVASAAYSFVRFIGGGLAPYAAGRMVLAAGIHFPF